MPAQIETMFSYREKPWHNLGTVVQAAPNSTQALQLSGLDWTVERQPLFTGTPAQEIPNFFANVRSSDQSVLGVVSSRYKIVQNADAFAFTDALAGSGDIRYETAGSLKGGRKIWMLAQLQGSHSLLGDTVEPYLCFVNSHDGTGAVRIIMTPIRVVCQNTLNVALRQAQRSWSTSHVGDISARFTEAQNTLGLAHLYMENLESEADILAQKRISVADLVAELLPISDGAGARAKQNILVNRESIIRAHRAPDLARFQDTAWGFINAVSDFSTHAQPARTSSTWRENRFDRVIGGDTLIDRAYTLVRAA